MNVKEQKSLLDSRDNTILSAVVKANDLKQQLLADQLKKLPEALCTNGSAVKNSCFLFLRGVSLAVSISLSTIDSTRLTYQLLYESG